MNSSENYSSSSCTGDKAAPNLTIQVTKPDSTSNCCAINIEFAESSSATYNEVKPDSTTSSFAEPRSLCSVDESGFEDSSAIPSLRFPQKLWRIVNECRSGAIRWGPDGLSILVDYDGFQRQYLSTTGSIFKTSNMASFIRQLNLYGFRKLTSHNRQMFVSTSVNVGAGPQQEQKVHEFLHENFKQGRLDLLSRVCRKTGVKKNSQLAQRIKIEGGTNKVHFDRLNDPVADELHSRSSGAGLTRLQMCQIALTKALEQATREYQEEKLLWLQMTQDNGYEDALKTNVKELVEPKIEIIFQDLSQIQNGESMSIIDAATLENIIGNQEKIQWNQVFTVPMDNTVSISQPDL